MSERTPRKQKAYILIRVQPGKETELYAELKQIPNVMEIDLVRGPFDFVVVAEGNASDLDTVVLRIRKAAYVLNTETMTAFEIVPWQEVSGQLDYGHI
jgi:DNA-binding Lrp family transcriptional regulator